MSLISGGDTLEWRLFSIDSQIVWDCWSESRPLSKGLTDEVLSVLNDNGRKAKTLVFPLCTVAHTTFYWISAWRSVPLLPQVTIGIAPMRPEKGHSCPPFPQTTMSSVLNTGSRLIISGADMLHRTHFHEFARKKARKKLNLHIFWMLWQHEIHWNTVKIDSWPTFQGN